MLRPISVRCQILPNHVLLSQRDKAWSIHPYPCIGSFRFLDLSISLSSYYPLLLSRLKSDPAQKFLDLGCCFAQDVRKLLFDGVLGSQITALDLKPEFIELGYELFQDREKLAGSGVTFLTGDIFDETSSALNGLEGHCDIIYTGSFFHLFGYEDQARVAERVVRLLRPVKGSVVLGRQRGNAEAGVYSHKTNARTGTMYRHNADSWKKMWVDVGKKTDTEWNVRAHLESRWGQGILRYGDTEWDGTMGEILRFEVERVR